MYHPAHVPALVKRAVPPEGWGVFGRTGAAQARSEPMIEALKSDDVVNKCGGRFKLCALIQRRLVDIMNGARPLVERDGRTDLELDRKSVV